MSRLAIVTGGTRGIGAAISVALKNAGYRVAANYAANDEAARAFTEQHGIKAYKWDVSDYDACASSVAGIAKEFAAPPAVLVNNAGITRDGMLHRTEKEQWDQVIATNLTSCFNMCRAVVPAMRDASFGRIVNISSINAQAGQLGQTNYAAAKAGIIGFTKSLAREGAIKNITVNVVAPGYIKTDMTAAVPSEFLEGIIAQIPVRRLGEPEEIARVVAFLADEASGFITGETLSVNGGHHMA
ncbi:MAG: acetoacetyl-CoA reductase [Rickettsiales bacterium]